jgi:catechol 2,3-dioxygenase-like lactoylglutathione lyase family enzyme
MKIDMIGVFVSDLAAMVAFYRDVMGMEVKAITGDAYAEFVHEGVRFSMYGRKYLPGLLGGEPSYPAGLNGTFELAFNVGAKENVDRVFAEVCAKGAKPVFAPRDEPWKMRSSMVVDPDGNLIEIGSDFWQ